MATSIEQTSRRKGFLTVTLAALCVAGVAAGTLAIFSGGDLKGGAVAAVGPEYSTDVELLPSQRSRDIDGFLQQVLPGVNSGAQADEEETGEQQPDNGARLVETIIKPGDTLARALANAGAGKQDAHNAANTLGKLTDLRRLRPGQELMLSFDAGTDALTEVRLKESVERTVLARLTDEGDFEAHEERTTFNRSLVRARADIRDSLFLAAGRAGLDHEVTAELIRIFSFDVDFQRGIHPGDSFELTFEQFTDDQGKVVKTGKILRATLTRKTGALTYYRYHPKGDTHPGYYNDKGKSAKKTLMQTPIDGARISSGYGRRRHPILGYTKMHKGVDFAARSGTPIMAAGDGVVEVIGWNGGYGRYIRLRHNGTYKTAYAHMKAFRSGLKKGARVRQGQIIGYVGTSGRSTGPHLHYEVIKNGKQTNPRSIKLPTGKALAGKDLKAYQAWRSDLDRQIAGLPWLSSPDVASAD